MVLEEKKEEKKVDEDVTMTNNEEKKESVPVAADTKKKELPAKDELSEEDKKLKENLELLLDVITEVDPTSSSPSANSLTLQRQSLDSLIKEIRSSTSSMTSIPKPLKFLKPHFQRLIKYFNELNNSNSNKSLISDILSVLSMTQANNSKRLTLKYKLESNQLNSSNNDEIGVWGHEYVRHLAGEIGKEFQFRQTENSATPYENLDNLIDAIVKFFMSHNAEFDAVDLLIEVEQLDKIQKYLVNEAENETTNKIDPNSSHHRACLYILKCSEFIIDNEEQKSMFNIVYQVYLSHHQFAESLRVAIRMHDEAKMTETLQLAESLGEDLIVKQLCFILGAHRIVLEEYKEKEIYNDIMGNVQLSQYFQTLAAELDVKEAKTPEDIYKSHLEEGGTGTGRRPVIRAGQSSTTGIDSAKQNLSSTFVNAFVNAGFGHDTLVTSEGSDWLFKNKSHGMLSAAASIGMIMMWDVENGFNSVDRFSFSTQTQIKAGTYLAHGILSSGITSEMDAASALLSEHIESSDIDSKLSAILGLGLAYVNTAREDILELLIPLIADSSQSMEVVSHAVLSLGLVFVGTAREDISGTVVESFLDRSETDLKDSTVRLMALGFGLLFLNRGSDVEPALIALSVIEHPIKKYLELTVTSCAYVGQASPIEIQKYLTVLLDHFDTETDRTKTEEEKKDAGSETTKKDNQLKTDPMRGIHQEVAVIGLALISMTEELTQEMAFRSLDHILQYGEVNVRRIIPLALGLLSISNPRLPVLDTLSKLSHDQDQIVSQNGIFAMGLIGAGTNNSRIASTLRSLASYYSKEPNHLFLVRLAQGLLHLGKGLLTLNPQLSDGFTINRAAMAGLLVSLHSAMDMQHTILGKRHYLLFSLVTAMRPRWLFTVNEELEQIKIPVRVGTRVDTVGQAGKPKSITGFQSHTTPVLISANERAEMASDEWLPLTTILEGIVVCKKNPDYKPTTGK